MNNKPLLSAKFPDPMDPDWSKIKFPVLVSPKLDGIRMRVCPIAGGAISRTAKLLPNEHLQRWVRENMEWMKFLDGEIMVTDPTASNAMNAAQSEIMAASGTPNLYYHVFDHWYHPEDPFEKRLEHARQIVEKNRASVTWSENGKIIRDIFHVPHHIVNNVDDILRFEEQYLDVGYEGIMIRSPDGRYKHGRSTLNENILVKLKRTEDDEGTVVGFEPLERNHNPLDLDAYGYAKRSSHKAGKVADDLLGALIVHHPEFGEFTIGSGFDVSTRQEIWQNKEKYLGQKVTYKFTRRGMKNKPRWPIFKGFRYD